MRMAQESGGGDEDTFRESREQSINLNTIVGDTNEEEVQEIRPEGMDKARAAVMKKKWSKSGSTSNVNDDALAKLMVTEMTAQDKKECLAYLDIKIRKVKCRERELEQQDMRFYLQPYDHLTGDQQKAMDEIRQRSRQRAAVVEGDNYGDCDSECDGGLVVQVVTVGGAVVKDKRV
nr:hypothetical protein [Tanacetum cinerariifolium]